MRDPAANGGSFKKAVERLETEQQPTGHLVGSQYPHHVLIHCEDVAQAAIEWDMSGSLRSHSTTFVTGVRRVNRRSGPCSRSQPGGLAAPGRGRRFSAGP